MKRLITLLKFNWRAFGISTFAILIGVITISFFSELNNLRSNIESLVIQYQIDIEGKASKSDILGMQEILKKLIRPNVEAIELSIPAAQSKFFHQLSFGNVSRNSMASKIFVIPIIANNVEIGTIRFDTNPLRILSDTISKNLHYLLILVALSIILLILSNRKFFLGLEKFKTTLERVVETGDLKLLEQSGHEKDNDYAGVYNLALSNVLKNQTLANFGMTLAHDIRSDLTAINFLVKNSEQRSLNKEEISALFGLTNHLNFLADKLLRNKATPENLKSIASPVLISQLVRSLFQSKILEYQSDGIKFEIINRLPINIFAHANESRLFSHLSNFLKNSIEAKGHNPLLIKIFIEQQCGCIAITIEDNGAGIPVEILAKINDGAKITSKGNKGNGLGISNAKLEIESWGGHLSIESEVGRGTTIRLLLPMAESPIQIPASIDLGKISKVVVVDDEPIFHQIWKKKLCSTRIPIIAMSSTSELIAYLDHDNKEDKTLFLIDNNLNESELGIDVIEAKDLQKRSILVTSQFDDPQLHSRLQSLGLKLLPKDLIELIQIDISPPITGTLEIFVDDDAFNRLIWETRAKEAGVNLKTFSSPEELFVNIDDIDKSTPIYVDGIFKNSSLKGESVARILKIKNFKNIQLVSALNSNEPGILYGNKSPPWVAKS